MPLHPEHLARLIHDDHARVLATIDHLEAGRGDRRRLADVLSRDLSLHAGAEEIVLYPALRDLPRGGDRKAGRSLDEHRAMKELLVDIERSDPGTANFERPLAELIVTLRTHIPDEEARVLPGVRAALGDERMAALGRQFAAVKLDLPTRAHPYVPTTPPANLAGGAVVATFDRLRDRLSGREKAYAADHSGLLDLDAHELLTAFGALRPKPIELLTPEIARRQPTIADAVRAVRRRRGQPLDPEPVALVVNRLIPGPNGAIRLRIYAPEMRGQRASRADRASASSPGGDGCGAQPHRGTQIADGGAAPVIVYAHGGGWVLGNLDVYDATPRALANRVGAVVVSVAYRRAPEHRFPAAHDDVLAATRWVLDRAAAVGGDPARVAIAGEGAGANLAAATAWQLLRAGDERLRFQLLAYPVASGRGGTSSYDDSADAVPLNRSMVRWFLGHALDDPAHATDPRIDLLGIPIERLRGLPPTLVITAERDPLRAEGEAFAQRLADAGVPMTATRYEGMPHDFLGTGAVVETARQALSQAAALMARHIGARRAVAVS